MRMEYVKHIFITARQLASVGGISLGYRAICAANGHAGQRAAPQRLHSTSGGIASSRSRRRTISSCTMRALAIRWASSLTVSSLATSSRVKIALCGGKIGRPHAFAIFQLVQPRGRGRRHGLGEELRVGVVM